MSVPHCRAADLENAPEYFTPMFQEDWGVYVNYDSFMEYALGCDYFVVGSVLAYNKLFSNSSTTYRVKLKIRNGAEEDNFGVGYVANISPLYCDYKQLRRIDLISGYRYYEVKGVQIPANSYFTISYVPTDEWYNMSVRMVRIYAEINSSNLLDVDDGGGYYILII